MRRLAEKIVRALNLLWLRLREWCGDAAYERYLRATARRPSAAVVSPEQFYVQQLERKYSRPNRCC
ncbi:MAG TPA: CstA-like transporter-associated (seleno)protein [Candidatus Acidoferrum sp.]|nr:CstA-like transporter-associated (seleno)protein [Candidatus Acidoferrum sp.]